MWLFQLAPVVESPKKKSPFNLNFYALSSASQVEGPSALSYKGSVAFRGKLTFTPIKFDDGSKVFLDGRATLGQVYSANKTPDNKIDLYASVKYSNPVNKYLTLETGAVVINTLQYNKDPKLVYQTFIKAYGPDTWLGKPALCVELNFKDDFAPKNINIAIEDYIKNSSSKIYLTYGLNTFSNPTTISFGAEANFKDIRKIMGL